MCGRYTLATPVAELSRIFGFSELPNLAPRYNIAPTQEIAAVRLLRDEERRELVLMRWGLVPYWAERLGRSDFTAAQVGPRGGDLACRLAGDRVALGGEARTVIEGSFRI